MTDTQLVDKIAELFHLEPQYTGLGWQVSVQPLGHKPTHQDLLDFRRKAIETLGLNGLLND
jgi:hypothetical protein